MVTVLVRTVLLAKCIFGSEGLSMPHYLGFVSSSAGHNESRLLGVIEDKLQGLESRLSALKQEVRGFESRSSPASNEELVCVSTAVYEPGEYIDVFLKNFLRFAEPSTRLMMHLDAATNYTDKDIERWKSTGNGRIAIPWKRIKVQPFMGSILAAHMINAEWMDEHWKKDTCAYFVYQASNMMWVRRGFEAQVRSRRYGQMRESPAGCDEGQRITPYLMKPRNVHGWGQPEGSFYPMSMVRNFQKLMLEYLSEPGHHIFDIENARCYMEAFSLQTYAINFEEEVWSNLTFYRESKPLSWNHVTYGDKDHDSCPQQEVIAIHDGRPGWEAFYAVKRVNRDVNHHVTKLINTLRP